MKKFLFYLTLILYINTLPSPAGNVWVNDLRTLFLSNNAIIYAVNLRTFAAQDVNQDGIIDGEEESGNFLNSIGRLDEIQYMGINTLHILPVMEVGKIHALGTAGSLYAPASFNQLNSQLKSQRSMLSIEKQFIKFINEAHKRNIRIIMDIPACGSYDLYKKNPKLFLKNSSGNPIQPENWTDVLILNGGTESSINKDVYMLYKDFVDYAIALGADGIRADVAPSKPAAFWKELIEYSRTQNPQMLWLAESAPNWNTPISKDICFTPYNKLLDAGFDGIYGNFSQMKDWRKASQLLDHIKFINSIKTKFSNPKSVIGDFSTHDEISPILINGPKYSSMIIWLNSTLPINSYFVDGFPTGDTYIYLYGNKQARTTSTDNDKYFVHRGKLDIFNFSREPGGNHTELSEEFLYANKFKNANSKIVANGKYTEFKIANPEIFAYAVSYDKTTYIVAGNISFKNTNQFTMKLPHFKENKNMIIPIKIKSIPKISNGKLTLNLESGEIMVILINDYEL